MANQDAPLWERLGMDHDLSLPWTSLNMVMALNSRLLMIPPEQSTIEKGKAFLMVNNRATYQRQSWIPDDPARGQVLFIPAASDENHLGPAIIEEHKLHFNQHKISLMFMWDPEDCITWDICSADQPNVHNIDQGMHNALKVPITIISNAHIDSCATCWMGEQKYKPQYATWRGLTEEAKVFKDILQRVIFTARFEDAMTGECEIICMWYEGTKRTETYVSSMGNIPEPA